jgi:8-oxo-dGTP pyrophosphatase MutT (NUDIX family)
MISFEKSVGAVVFRKSDGANMYLLLHYRSGHWDFPKGHTEDQETDHETLIREVSEEAGLNDLKIIPNFKTQVRFFYRAGEEEKARRKKEGRFANVSKKVVYYIAETKTKFIKISFEHIGFEWLGFEDALARITFKNSKTVLRKADKHLKSVL